MHQVVGASSDLYALLDVTITANSNDIKAAYHRAALAAHPDKGGSEEAFHAVKLAFDVLSSEGRHAYDQFYKQQLKSVRRRMHMSSTSIKDKYGVFQPCQPRTSGLKSPRSALDVHGEVLRQLRSKRAISTAGQMTRCST